MTMFRCLNESRVFTSVIRKNTIQKFDNYGRGLCSKDDFRDIIVVGGGLVGFCFAAFAAASKALSHRRILVLESAAPVNPPSEKYGNRVIAVSPVSKRLFEDTGIWKYIEEGRYQQVKRMQVWEANSESFITFERDDPQSDLACIVENDLVQHAMLKSIQTSTSQVAIKFGSRLTAIDLSNPQFARIKLDDGSSMDAALLVGADGFNSAVRKSAQIHTVSWKHNQKAIVATMHLNEGNDRFVAWQRFLTTGPIALLPLNERQSSLVWSTTLEQADRLMRLSEEDFVRELNDELWRPSASAPLVVKATSLFDAALDRILPGPGVSQRNLSQLPPTVHRLEPGSRVSFPLGFSHASNYVRQRVALIGDAAHRILPLAGQGANLGFGDCAALVRHLEQACLEGADPGNLSYLQDYETERQRYVVPVAATIESLQFLYTSQLAPVVLARALGLKFTNSVHPLKRFIVDSATSGKLTLPFFG